MTLKKIIFIFLALSFTVSETAAKEYKFILQKDDNNKLNFVLDLDQGDIIYSNKKNETNAFPSSIKLYPARNLKNYHLEWPKAKSKNKEGIGYVEYFEGRVIIPLNIEAYDYTKPINLKADLEFVVCNNQCIPVRHTVEKEVMLEELAHSFWQYCWFIIAAIFGGFILNFMPCVLPVLSLKILSFTKNENIDKKTASALTVIGIFSCFWLLSGAMILLKHSGREFGLGVNFQEPEFIIILTIIITFFISLSLGRLNIGTFGIGNNINKLHFSNSYIEHYFSGIIATILSTPCNAPFIGSALAFAFGVSDVLVVLMFTSIAFGFSLPYIALILHPKILNFLPKPGAWMDRFKNFLVFLLIGTVIWLLWVLSYQIGERASIGLFLLLLLFKFSIETKSGLLRCRSIKVLIIIIICTASMLLPKYAYREDESQAKELSNVWKKFEPEQISHLVNQGKIIFIDITADWCVTCKYNKFMVLNRDRTLKLLKENNVVAMRGDFTSKNKEIYKFLRSYDSIGIPFYIMFGASHPEGVVLPLVIKFDDIKSAINVVK